MLSVAAAAVSTPSAAQTNPELEVETLGGPCAGSQVVSTQEVCRIPGTVTAMSVPTERTRIIGEQRIEDSFVHVLPANVDPAHISDNSDGTNAAERQERVVEGSDPPETEFVEVVCGRPYASREKLNIHGSYTKVAPSTGSNACETGQVSTREQSPFIAAPAGLALAGPTGECSDDAHTTESACTAKSAGTWTSNVVAGSCSVSTHADQGTCEAAGATWTSGSLGSCSISTRTTQKDCEANDWLEHWELTWDDPATSAADPTAIVEFRQQRGKDGSFSTVVDPTDGAYAPFCSGDYGYFRGVRPGETDPILAPVCYQIRFRLQVTIGTAQATYNFHLRENSNGPTSVPWNFSPPPPAGSYHPCEDGPLRADPDDPDNPNVWQRLEFSTWTWWPCWIDPETRAATGPVNSDGGPSARCDACGGR